MRWGRRVGSLLVGVVLATGACSANPDPVTGPAPSATDGSAGTAGTGTGPLTGPSSSAAGPGPTAAPSPPATTVGEGVWVDPASSGRPWGTTTGFLTFRGNPTRTWYGVGPVPSAPRVRWRFPADGSGMCARSSTAAETKVWCGTGWTGQPNVWERPDGRTWVLFGAMDRRYHILDAATGVPVMPPLVTGDIVKGSATLDPDGFPLYYGGSRDNLLRVIALDRDEPEVLWSLDSTSISPRLWNTDWDSTPLVLDDFLIAGGENSQWHVIKLNRGYRADGKVTVDPELVFHAPGWDDRLLAEAGDRNVSIESSVAVSGDTVWFANSGGLVQGWDIAGLREGRRPERVFRFWMGDDVDATIVVDAEGFLYVAAEYERFTARSREVGQLVKLDPRRPDDPVVWSVADRDERFDGAAGFWATPALHRGVVINATNAGRLLGIDQATGEILWTVRLSPASWQSPVVVDDVLIMGDCSGVLRGFDVRDPRRAPAELWRVELGGCIESTPTVWKGRIYVGTRAGGFYALD